MATATPSSEMSLIVTELQKSQGTLGDRLSKMEEMLCKLVQQKVHDDSGSSSALLSSGGHSKHWKLEIPRFDGSDAEDWVHKIKQFFCFYVTPSDQKIQDTMEYLGHIISKRGVHMDPSKVDAMLNWPTPTTVKQLRGFLGLTGYYRKFVKDYAAVAYDLTELLKRNHFFWNASTEKAFNDLKVKMTQAPVLTLPNFQKTFVVETDASNTGVGAVLSQEGHPVAYFSKKLSKKLSLSSAYVRELYAITQAVMKWRHYLLGRKFVVKTDHQSLKELMRQVVQTPEQQFYLTKLMGFDFDVEYRSGRTNLAADALSRQGDALGEQEGAATVLALTEVRHELFDILKRANEEDEDLKDLHQLFQQGKLATSYTLREHILKAQARMKKLADEKRQEKEFAEGSWVWVKFQPYKQTTAAKRLSFKLAKRYYGPFQIQTRVGTVAYHLQLPPDAKVHPVFHVSRLKGVRGPLPTVIDHLPEHPLAFVQQPTAIINSRQVMEGDSVRRQVLVEWEGGDRTDASWEDLVTLTKAFPELQLEDKLVFNGEGIDMITGGTSEPITAKEIPTGPNTTETQPVREKRGRRPPIWAKDYEM
ncbi:Ty3/gypsy retrotransposon protein [Senna tora]|uniref:Ty3/gypsy retrotransposon protein n=2 Tax=Senna tora TaxID=362788 RepID=A0A834SNP0_9FABA|nr:Ty3/gypsy retrotransposon protein [Senna tora]